MKYKPGPVPAGLPASARDYLARELSRIAQALEGVDNLSLATQGAEPDKYSDGDVVYADGTSWDPGSGEGAYVREGGAWVKSGGGGGASQLSDLSDVNTSTPTDKNFLVADGVDWESRAISSDDLSDVSSVAMLDEAEAVTGWWDFEGRIDFENRVWFKNDVTYFLYSTTANGSRFLPATSSFTWNAQGTCNLLQFTGWNKIYFKDGCQPRFYDAAGTTILDINQGANNTQYVFTSPGAMVWNVYYCSEIAYRDGCKFRLRDSTNNDYVTIQHDGTDVNFTHSGTTDWNITGITAIQAGTVDADFDAITATSYGGITETNLVDKSAAETVTGAWVYSTGLNALNESRSVSASTNTASTDYGMIVNLTGGTGQTFTLDGDPPTDAVVLLDNSSGNTWTIAASTSLIWASDGSTGNRTLADDGLAVAKHRGSGTWVINGGGLT